MQTGPAMLRELDPGGMLLTNRRFDTTNPKGIAPAKEPAAPLSATIYARQPLVFLRSPSEYVRLPRRSRLR